MTLLSYLLAAFAILAGGLLSLMMFALLIAGAANSKPENEWKISAGLWGTGGGGLLCFLVGTLLTILQNPLWGGIIGGMPFVLLLVILIWLKAAR